VRGAEDRIAVRLLTDQRAGLAHRLVGGLVLGEPDHEGGARRQRDHAVGDGADAAVLVIVAAELPDHDEVGEDVGREDRDLLGRVAGAHVQARAPVAGAEVERVDAAGHELEQAGLEILQRLLVVLADRDEVEVRRVVPRGLVERVLEHDLRVLRQIEADDDAEPATIEARDDDRLRDGFVRHVGLNCRGRATRPWRDSSTHWRT